MAKFGRSVHFYQSEQGKAKIPADADVIFTSLHDAEEFSKDFASAAPKFLASLLETGAQVIADISPRGIKAFGASSLKDFAKFGERLCLRCDFGFSKDEVFEAADFVRVSTNASSCDWRFAVELQKAGKKVLACHNFYPRIDTGLDDAYFCERNVALREAGLKIAAFISGDVEKRFPIFAGLPTLERHRYLPPYSQYVQMERLFGVDEIIVGDAGISDGQKALIQAFRADGIIRIPAILDKTTERYYDIPLTCREDSPAGLVRVLESREYATFGATIEPADCGKRDAGAITIDNRLYERYSGEVQIMRRDYPSCPMTNIAGKICEGYLPVLDSLGRGERFMFVRP